jgi:hypothetical protein
MTLGQPGAVTMSNRKDTGQTSVEQALALMSDELAELKERLLAQRLVMWFLKDFLVSTEVVSETEFRDRAQKFNLDNLTEIPASVKELFAEELILLSGVESGPPQFTVIKGGKED